MDFIGHVPTKDLIGEGGRYSFGKTKLYECLDTLGIQRVSRDGDRQACRHCGLREVDVTGDEDDIVVGDGDRCRQVDRVVAP
jgi:hypothetical protein